MTVSLVEQLQTDAVDRNVRTSDLLRKALLVSSKLDIPGVPEWINKELSGYNLDDDVPSYRKIHGRVLARTWQGWTPVQFPTNDSQTKVAEQHVYQSVATIEELLSNEGEPRIDFPPEAQKLLQDMFQRETQFTCVHSRASLAAILDEARNQILRWSMELDRAGVKGEGLTFSQQEKNLAHNIVVQGVLNVGVLGNVQSATNIATGDHARAGIIGSEEIQQLIAAIEPHLPATRLVSGDEAELRRALATLKNEAAKGEVEVGKLRPILLQVLKVASKIGDHIIAAGIKVTVEALMRAHGMVP